MSNLKRWRWLIVALVLLIPATVAYAITDGTDGYWGGGYSGWMYFFGDNIDWGPDKHLEVHGTRYLCRSGSMASDGGCADNAIGDLNAIENVGFEVQPLMKLVVWPSTSADCSSSIRSMGDDCSYASLTPCPAAECGSVNDQLRSYYWWDVYNFAYDVNDHLINEIDGYSAAAIWWQLDSEPSACKHYIETEGGCSVVERMQDHQIAYFITGVDALKEAAEDAGVTGTTLVAAPGLTFSNSKTGDNRHIAWNSEFWDKLGKFLEGTEEPTIQAWPGPTHLPDAVAIHMYDDTTEEDDGWWSERHYPSYGAFLDYVNQEVEAKLSAFGFDMGDVWVTEFGDGQTYKAGEGTVQPKFHSGTPFYFHEPRADVYNRMLAAIEDAGITVALAFRSGVYMTPVPPYPPGTATATGWAAQMGNWMGIENVWPDGTTTALATPTPWGPQNTETATRMPVVDPTAFWATMTADPYRWWYADECEDAGPCLAGTAYAIPREYRFPTHTPTTDPLYTPEPPHPWRRQPRPTNTP